MATVFRPLIQASLEIMEPGRFQDFCLHFLPCFADRFAGLERHGHTAGGKTRPGIPDLIKLSTRESKSRSNAELRLAMLVSSTSMNAAIETTAAITHGLTRRFAGVDGSHGSITFGATAIVSP